MDIQLQQALPATTLWCIGHKACGHEIMHKRKDGVLRTGIELGLGFGGF